MLPVNGNSGKELFLPAITGQFAQWRYYQLIMKVGDIVANFSQHDYPDYRIKTVEEVEVIYSKKGVSNLLQRAFDPNRLNPIKQYLLEQPDKYINNLTVAIFDGNPTWMPLDVRRLSDLGLQDESSLEEISKTFGIIHLTGNETLFVLDGQHRLMGLREAVKESENLRDEAVAITLITHNDTPEGIRRTRRLFATINRHAKPVSEGENILLDEDDVSAIIVRSLVEEYELFAGRDIIALNKTANLKRTDTDKFTTVISLWNVNEILIDHSRLYQIRLGKNKFLKIRPVDEAAIEDEKNRVFRFWDEFFSLFPKAREFVLDSRARGKDYRKKGGPFYMRPVGQEVVARVYKRLTEEDQKVRISYLANIEENLNSEFWHFVLWDPYKEKIINDKSLASSYLLYRLGLSLPPKEVDKLANKYKKNSGGKRLTLPGPLYQ